MSVFACFAGCQWQILAKTKLWHHITIPLTVVSAWQEQGRTVMGLEQ
jgi:hypothetical protein